MCSWKGKPWAGLGGAGVANGGEGGVCRGPCLQNWRLSSSGYGVSEPGLLLGQHQGQGVLGNNRAGEMVRQGRRTQGQEGLRSEQGQCGSLCSLTSDLGSGLLLGFGRSLCLKTKKGNL